jgi:hypothetical protein
VRDLEYFFRRAEQELEMAAASEVPEAVRAHYVLAGYYLDRCYGGGDQGRHDGDLALALANHAALTTAH